MKIVNKKIIEQHEKLPIKFRIAHAWHVKVLPSMRAAREYTQCAVSSCSHTPIFHVYVGWVESLTNRHDSDCLTMTT